MKVPKLDFDDLQLDAELLGQLLRKIGVDALDLAGLRIAVGNRIIKRVLADLQLAGLSDLVEATNSVCWADAVTGRRVPWPQRLLRPSLSISCYG